MDGEIADLPAGADILITSSPGMGAQGVATDPAALHERFPQLVVTSITPYGLEGPVSPTEPRPS